MRLNVVLVYAMPLFTTVVCFPTGDVIGEPVSIAEYTNKAGIIAQLRIKRQAFGLENGETRPYLAAKVQSRAPTVIVVPERGTAAVPAYGTGAMSPYPVNTPGKGTTVVVNQVPDRSYDIVPVNSVPIRI